MTRATKNHVHQSPPDQSGPVEQTDADARGASYDYGMLRPHAAFSLRQPARSLTAVAVMTKVAGLGAFERDGRLGSAAVLTIYGQGTAHRPAAARDRARRGTALPGAGSHPARDPASATPVSAHASMPAREKVARCPAFLRLRSVPVARVRHRPGVPSRASTGLSARASTVSPEAPSAPAPVAELGGRAPTLEPTAAPAAPATPAAVIPPTPCSG
jgi:hypothetical protein